MTSGHANPEVKVEAKDGNKSVVRSTLEMQMNKTSRPNADLWYLASFRIQGKGRGPDDADVLRKHEQMK